MGIHPSNKLIILPSHQHISLLHPSNHHISHLKQHMHLLSNQLVLLPINHQDSIHPNSNMDPSTNSPPMKQPRSQSIIHPNNNISLQKQLQNQHIIHPKQPRSQSTIHPRSKLIKSLVMLLLHQHISLSQHTSQRNHNMLHLQHQLKLHTSFMLVIHQFISTNNHKSKLYQLLLHQLMGLQNRSIVNQRNLHMVHHLQNLQPIKRKNQCIPHHPSLNQLTKLPQNQLIILQNKLTNLPDHLTKLQLPNHLITNQSHPSIKLQPSPPHTRCKNLQNISQNLQNTSQSLQNTSHNLQSISQNLQSISQDQLQNLQSTSQDLLHHHTKNQNNHQSMKLLLNQSHPSISHHNQHTIPNKLILLLKSLLLILLLRNLQLIQRLKNPYTMLLKSRQAIIHHLLLQNQLMLLLNQLIINLRSQPINHLHHPKSNQPMPLQNPHIIHPRSQLIKDLHPQPNQHINHLNPRNKTTNKTKMPQYMCLHPKVSTNPQLSFTKE